MELFVLKPVSDAVEYTLDWAERSVLFWDVMRERGDRYRAHRSQEKPSVLGFESEVVIDGHDLADPCNYYLLRITAPEPCHLAARPVVIVDPRAGHGPGIAGFKSDSEIGVALANGLPCYFVGFRPEPLPTQTIDSVRRAEIRFLEHVIAAHPEADGLPFVIGNCQAGWALMMVAASRPELVGPLLLAGAPLEYWAGHRGQNPMRYSGGLLGGSWLTAATSALGGGRFDGAWLVQNFENLNPANTLLGKPYGLYSNVDDEAERFLNFETWWGGHVSLNASEIQWIVDQLFIGNRLARGQIVTDDGIRLDLRRIRSPIICFCSEGDNITPPPQALGWILDLYDGDEGVLEHQQTIVYAIHDEVGHLGIFVSSSVARKEYSEMTSNVDLIDMLAPGIYELVLKKADDASKSTGFVVGDYVTRFEPRSIEDVRAIVKPDPAEQRAFETVARFSQNNVGLYRQFVAPFVRVPRVVAKGMRVLRPLRFPYEVWSSANPWAKGITAVAEEVRANRHRVNEDNRFRGWEKTAVRWGERALDGVRVARDTLAEKTFFAIYGSPVVQALVGVNADYEHGSIGDDPVMRENRAFKKRELMGYLKQGGKVAAFFRALLYVGGEKITYDERIFHAFKRAQRKLASDADLSVVKQRQISRDQYLMLRYDREAALASIPEMLPEDPEERRELVELLDHVLEAGGGVRDEQRARYERVRGLFC